MNNKGRVFMDNKKSIIICSIVALVILATVLLITFAAELYGFFVVLLTLFIILLISLGFYIKEKPDEYSIFQKEKKRILKAYSSAIIEVENLPNIAGKNIIKVKSMDDLVDAQLELREPIYYKNDIDSCFFLLLHYNEACIYILRLNPDVISPTEQSLRFIQKEDTKKLNYESLLDNIENTLVLKLDELRSVKISPVRNKKKIEVLNPEVIKETIKENKAYNENTLIDELSKTSLIKNLKDQINNLEQEYHEEKNVPEKEIPKERIKKETTKQEVKLDKEESIYDLMIDSDKKEIEELLNEDISLDDELVKPSKVEVSKEEVKEPEEKTKEKPVITEIKLEEVKKPKKKADTESTSKKTRSKKTAVKSNHSTRRASSYKKKNK